MNVKTDEAITNGVVKTGTNEEDVFDKAVTSLRKGGKSKGKA
jgi:hypothetical protein